MNNWVINYLIKNKPLIYYFLSGFLGKNSTGCDTETVQKFLRDKSIYDFNSTEEEFKNNLKIITFNYDDDTHFTFNKLINQESLKYNFDTNNVYVNNIVKDNTNIIQNFNNLIFILGEDNHATNLVFFIKDDYLYILSINTGLGISEHKNINEYYSPYYCFKINIKVLQSNTQQLLYEETNSKFYEKHTSIKQSIKPLNLFIYKISCMLMFSKLYNELDNFNKSFFEYNLDSSKTIKTINKIKKMALQIGIQNDINNLFTEPLKIKNKINTYIKPGFYNLFINYIKYTLYIDIATDDFNKILFDKLGENISEFDENNTGADATSATGTTATGTTGATGNIKINKRLYLKHRLYLFENNFYIHEQESGSCSFYSLYWAILINTLFNYSYDKYKHMLKIFEEKMSNEIPKFVNFFLEKKNYNYPFVSTILHKLSNLQILNKNNIDIHDNYLYNKHFKYEKSKNGILSNNFFESYNYLNSLNLLLIPPNFNTQIMFKKDVNVNVNSNNNFYNTKIFLMLYKCFIESPEIFNPEIFNIDIKHLTSKKTLASKKNEEFVNLINTKLETAKKELEDFIIYTKLESAKTEFKDYLNIYSVQYYYIAKSIVEFCFKYNKSNNEKIIKFCNFIHKFFLFNKLFNCLLKQILYDRNQDYFNNELYKIVNTNTYYDTIFRDFIFENDANKNDAKHYIRLTLYKLIKRETLDLLFNQSKFKDNDEFVFNDINFFNDFYNNLFKNNSTTYLDGFTINFNFPPPSIDNTDKLKIMRYPEKQLTSITKFLYDNPRYLYNDFNNNYIFNNNYFVETNIIEILKNDEYKNKLDKYYRHLFFDAVKKNKLPDEINYFGKKILLLNNYSFESNTYDFRRNSNSLDKEKELINELLIKEIKDISKTYLTFEKKELETDDIKTKLKKYKIDDQQLEMIDCLDEFKLLFNTDNADVFLNTDTKIIYIFYENYYLVIYNDRVEENKIKITSISINNRYDVIRRNKIIESESLFIYFIPSACLSLIYKINDQYNVLCIASKFNNDECEVLFKKNEISNKYKIFNYSIDSSNLLNLSFDKDPQQIDKLNYFIENYGVNNLNYIYLKDWNNKGVQEITKNDFNLLYSFNSDYIITDYCKYYKEENTKIKKKLSEIVTTDKQNYINYSLIKVIDVNDVNYINKISFAIKPPDKEDSKIQYLSKLYDIKDIKDIGKSLEKLNFKLSECIINNNKPQIIEILTKFIDEINSKIIEQYNIIKDHIINNKPILDLMYNPINISNYTYLLKLRILCTNLLKDLNNNEILDEAICSKIKTIENSLKVMKSKFEYVFEYLFEFILGINVLDEQFNKYVEIINNYSKTSNRYDKKDKIYDINENIFNVVKVVDNVMVGGSYKNYPLHHIMMGKGKSSVLTPLLSLYFCLIDKKKVYIIVPPHLVNQTKKTFINIKKIFELENDILIKSDKDIKLEYLNGEKYDNSIFLIDEFDTILDPLKSNFNLTNEQCEKKIDKHFSDIFKNTINDILLYDKEYINNTDENTIKSNIKKILAAINGIKNSDLIESEICNVLLNIKNNILKYNINWGIHPEKGYAIPYMNKDTPLLESNFNSIILTLVLTYYYYTKLYINDNLIFDMNLVSTFIYHKLQRSVENVFKVVLSDIPEEIHSILNKFEMIDKRKLLYNLIVPKIIESIKLCEYQYNLSFVDIINIPNVYKIGYSGTVNIDLPEELVAEHKFTNDNITKDLDEKYNVYYSLLVYDVIMPKSDEIEKSLNNNSKIFIDIVSNINDYDAIIDTAGLFRYEPNETIAELLYKQLIKRPIIYLNNQDDILVFDESQNQKYDSNKIYDDPFFYYSQKHTVGIDIKQDNYPILKGLCIIDNLNTYTEVAQSVFRLRKLNQGHTIQLFCINKLDISRNEEMIDRLVENDKNNQISKNKNLQYQIIKANIRAKNVSSDEDVGCVKDGLITLDKRFKEKVKYFFDDDDVDYDTQNDILQEILAPSSIDNLKTKIDNQQKLINIIDVKKLVYNLNSTSFSIMEEQTTQIALNMSLNELSKLQISGTQGNLINSDFSEYSHNNININIDKDIVEQNLILYDSRYYQILFNPSLLTSLTQIDDKTNYLQKSAYFSPLLIVCKIKKEDYLEIILCDSTDIFLYKDHLIINHSGNIINKTEYDDRLIYLLKNNKFIYFLSKNDFESGKYFVKENVIFFHIFYKICMSNKIISDCDNVIDNVFNKISPNIDYTYLIYEIEKLIIDY